MEIMERVETRISHPVLTDLSIDYGSMRGTDVYPQILPGLIVGRPITVTGRYIGEPRLVKIGGRSGNTVMTIPVLADTQDAKQEHSAIAAVWALENPRADGSDVTSTQPGAAAAAGDPAAAAPDYRLMSPLTAFVAVDS